MAGELIFRYRPPGKLDAQQLTIRELWLQGVLLAPPTAHS
jgi:hypothetical protein